jgi:hypothetical protein
MRGPSTVDVPSPPPVESNPPAPSTTTTEPPPPPSTAPDAATVARPGFAFRAHPDGFVAAPNGVATRIELSQQTMEPDAAIEATLVVNNITGSPINLNDFTPNHCAPSFAIVLTSDSYPPPGLGYAGHTTCTLEPFVVQAGENRYSATLGCVVPRAEVAICNVGPSTPGEYQAVLKAFGDLALPPPEPVPITIVPASEP